MLLFKRKEKNDRFMEMENVGRFGRRFPDKVKAGVNQSRIWMILFLFLCCMVIKGSVLAQEEVQPDTAVQEKMESLRSSIVHIESICWDGKETVYRTKGFSGFVVSTDTTGVYVVTAANDLNYTAAELKKIKTKNKLEDNVTLSEKIEVVFGGDLRVRADIMGTSEQRNLAILKLEEDVCFEQALLFAEEDVLNKENVYLLSYPGSENSDKQNYNEENVSITQGTIYSPYQAEEIVFLKHDILADEESVGGPLVGEDGCIRGVLLTASGEKAGKAISSQSMKEFLKTYNINYEVWEQEEVERQFPVIQVVLGGVILILFFFVMGTVRKEKKDVKKTADRYTSGTVKEDTAVPAKRKQEKCEFKNIQVSLEYPAEKRIVFIKKKVFLIGRAQEADFILSDSTGVSRKHASIQYDGKEFFLMDLQSTNHTFLNGVQLVAGEKKKIKNGDKIMIGKEELIFHKVNTAFPKK